MRRLSEARVRNAKPRSRPCKLFDGGGLYVLVQPTGAKLWRLKYRFGGTEKLLALGRYPEVGLGKARERADEARRLLADRIDPAAVRKAEKAGATGGTFEALAREWYAQEAGEWAPSHGGRILRRLERDVFPHVGTRPVSEIAAPELLAVLRRIEARGAVETAHRARQNCEAVLDYAIATGRCERNVARDLRGALKPARGTSLPAVTKAARVGEILRAVESYRGTGTVRAALRLLPLLAVRPGELRHARWEEIDLDGGLWSIPPEKTKARIWHLVPLAPEAVRVLRDELLPLTGPAGYVFPSERSRMRCMSENTLNAAYRRLGIEKTELVGHGWRACFRTLGVEALGFPVDLVEHQLGHRMRGPLGRSYDRAEFLAERRRLMDEWARYLDELRAPPLRVVEYPDAVRQTEADGGSRGEESRARTPQVRSSG